MEETSFEKIKTFLVVLKTGAQVRKMYDISIRTRRFVLMAFMTHAFLSLFFNVFIVVQLQLSPFICHHHLKLSLASSPYNSVYVERLLFEIVLSFIVGLGICIPAL